jgi:hypothetical protein
VIRRLVCAAAFLVLMPAQLAAADTFGGFGGREDGYLVGKDRLCTPLAVDQGIAKGSPSCQKSSDDQIAQFDIKTPKAVTGMDASYTASAKSRTLTVTARDAETPTVTWESVDAISKVNALYLSTYGNVVAVEYTTRRGGKEVTDVVAFDLHGQSKTGTDSTTTDPVTTIPTGIDEPPPMTKAMTKVLKAARKTVKGNAKKSIKAWGKVLALDPDSSEGRLGLAIAQARAKKLEDALVTLEALAASTRIDATEYLMLARFDKAFAKLRADERYRAATGLDKPYGTFYERLMGSGGTWEQAGTACDTPDVAFVLKQDRTFTLKISGNCSGDRYSYKFKGQWKPAEPVLTLIFANKGRADESFDCAISRDSDEDAISCTIDQDLSFVVRPVRR